MPQYIEDYTDSPPLPEWTAEEMDAWERSREVGLGPKCPCCYRRNMQRLGYCIYRCQRTNDAYLFAIDHDMPSGYRMDKLEVE